MPACLDVRDHLFADNPLVLRRVLSRSNTSPNTADQAITSLTTRLTAPCPISPLTCPGGVPKVHGPRPEMLVVFLVPKWMSSTA
jgi:hypothetical protein